MKLGVKGIMLTVDRFRGKEYFQKHCGLCHSIYTAVLWDSQACESEPMSSLGTIPRMVGLERESRLSNVYCAFHEIP